MRTSENELLRFGSSPYRRQHRAETSIPAVPSSSLPHTRPDMRERAKHPDPISRNNNPINPPPVTDSLTAAAGNNGTSESISQSRSMGRPDGPGPHLARSSLHLHCNAVRRGSNNGW
jgi:hypothetical protein